MIKTRINNKNTFRVEKKGEEYYVNDSFHKCDIQKVEDNIYLLHLNNTTFLAHITQTDNDLVININHNEYQLEIQDENDLILEKLGINQKTVKRHEQLHAPMPGLIIDIMVKNGDVVKSGQPLIILKAMKMENIIKSPHDGVITEVFVKKDQKIEKDAVMIQF